MKRSVAILLLSLSAVCLAKPPPCDRWPTNVAEGRLRNEGIIDPTKIDHSKTMAVRLASEKIGKDRFYGKDLYREVYHITYYENSGKQVSVITVNDAGWSECSMSGVEVFLVSQHMGPVEPLIKELK
ncbi:hypothetical protein LJ655_02870 [Paraburkholderia sp. MMS20-SJTN17]|uniref:Uncharacterized protein n=1 Tax=Paraburkholderia translucens TaxID=2886945 RepID=A0ABS8K850_9BURK|nr:hypothetical protein [Paraburkholderia sp. MMS20-SJTN17]MCC8400847.1 hypothetical protein [Paraburkholderia sp. MMS20-SJTN17]